MPAKAVTFEPPSVIISVVALLPSESVTTCVTFSSAKPPEREKKLYRLMSRVPEVRRSSPSAPAIFMVILLPGPVATTNGIAA